MSRGEVWHYLLLGLCLVVLGVFLGWPIGLVVVGGFETPVAGGGREWTLEHVVGVFADPVLREGLANSLLIAVTVTGLCLVLSLPLAVLASRFEFPGKGLFSGLILVPLILPPFVGAIGLRHLLGRYGAVNALLERWGLIDWGAPIDFLGGARFWGVVVMEALHLYPIVYLNTTAALANVDPTLEQAAENLGAGRWLRFRRITLPLIVPGMFAGATIVFVWSFTELGTPLMFDYSVVTPVQIFWGLQEMAVSPRPYALVVVMLSVAVVLYGLGRWLVGGRAYAAGVRAMVGAETWRLGGAGGVAAAAAFGVVIAAALLPHVSVIGASVAEPGAWYRSVLPSAVTGEHFAGALRHPLAGGSIRNSLLYAGLATLVDIVLGLTVAWLIVRTRVRGRGLLDALAMLPLAVPGLVLAFGYVAMTLHWPFPQMASYFESRGLEGLAALCRVTGQSPNPLVFLVIAYAVRRLPYLVRSTVAGLQQSPVELEEAARNLGASSWCTLRRVVVPLILANLIAGALLTFSFAMLEVSDSLILAQSEAHYPMTKAIYVLSRRLGDGPHIASAMGVWGMALMAVTLVGAAALLGRRLGALFRV